MSPDRQSASVEIRSPVVRDEVVAFLAHLIADGGVSGWSILRHETIEPALYGESTPCARPEHSTTAGGGRSPKAAVSLSFVATTHPLRNGWPMAWESESWQRFLDTAVQIASGKRHDWRNLFLLYPYDPADEREALVGAQLAREACDGQSPPR